MFERIEGLDFKKGGGLIPAVIQDAVTSKVLMVGWMNEESYGKTLETGLVTFFSRSRQKLWTKGEHSGHFLYVKEIIADCDRDTLLVKAIPDGPICHTGADTCFNEENKPLNSSPGEFIEYLEGVIKDRKAHPAEGSYTNRLFERGIPRCAQKVGEEAVETVIESMRNEDELFLGEAADLMYHYLVLLTAKGFSLSDVTDVLKQRHKR